MEGGGAIFLDSDSQAVIGGSKAKKVRGVKGDSVSMGVRVGVGTSPNKILANITNLDQQPKQHISTEQLLREKEMLVKVLANRDAIIESCKAELLKCQSNYQKLRKQNGELALTNSQMLAELNSSRQKLRELQLELGSKNGVLHAMRLELTAKEHTVKSKHETDANEVGVCQSKQSDRSLQEDNRGNEKRKRMSKSRSSAPAVVKQVKSTEKVDDKRYSLRRQSAGLKAEKPEPTKDLSEVVEVKDEILQLQENFAKETGPTSLGLKVHDEAREATECDCTQLIPFCYFLLLYESLMHIVCMQLRDLLTLDKLMPKRILKKRGKHILPLSEYLPTCKQLYDSLHSMRRQSNRFRPEKPEATEDLFETDDAKFSVSQLSDNMSEEICPTTSSVTCGQENNCCTIEPQETRRSSVGRPLRRTVEKIVSYKEVPLNVKMRRDKSGIFVIGSQSH
uniref:Shugoshin-1 n=1 Tax=Cajanus cajan TaxID=3821 RepID=A0A151T128_CAJCA|nr:Shugoshin-1 [Cajanus cajan]